MPLQRLIETAEQHFAWKVRQRKRRDRNPLLVTFQDKYEAKRYALERGVKSAELLWITDEAATLPLEKLPPDYFIKATHGQNWNIRCAGSQLYLYRNGANPVKPSSAHENPSPMPSAPTLPIPELSKQACVALCHDWLNRSYSASEWAYTKIEPRLIVEAPLTQREGEQLFDYRFYTFGGKVKAISLGSPLYRQGKLNVFFTPAWDVIKLSRYVEALPSPVPDKPDTLGEMIATAELLGKNIDFVRVDLYDTAQGVMLGELTVYPHAGLVGTPTGCRTFNRWLGQQWTPTVASRCSSYGRAPGRFLKKAGSIPELF